MTPLASGGERINPELLGLETFRSLGPDEVKVRCPYHDDRTPSAEFNTRSGLFFCFVCGVGKTAKQIAKDMGGEVRGMVLPERREGFDEPEIGWRTRLAFMPPAYGNEYLIERQVTEDQITKFGIREFEDGIAFPMFTDEEWNICGFQARYYTRHPKYVFYGERPPIYPLIALPYIDGHKIFLVEGVFGVLRGRLFGKQVFATLGSSALTGAVKIFFDRSKVIGLFDPDFAGYMAMAKLSAVGIACASIPFVADEEDEEAWENIENQVTMDVGFFARKAMRAGGSPATIAKQIKKFEKEHG